MSNTATLERPQPPVLVYELPPVEAATYAQHELAQYDKTPPTAYTVAYLGRHAIHAERLSLRERFHRSRLGRTVFNLAIATGFIASVVALEAAPAVADSGQEYTVTDDASGGVYARNSPHTEDTDRINGRGIYPNDIVRLICGVKNGDPVGKLHHNTTWHKIVNETRPELGEFWDSDHYLNTPNKAGELAPGEKECNQIPSTDSQSPGSSATNSQPCYFNMKAPSLNLGFSYGGDSRYYGNAWQAAKEWTDLDTGLSIRPSTDDTYIKFVDMYSRTVTWAANTIIPPTIDWLGHTRGESWSHFNTSPEHPHVPVFVVIEVNQYQMDPLDNDHRTYALAHEIGHALGLAHSDDCNVNEPSIMKSGGNDASTRSVITPQKYDKVELEELYNLPRQ